MSGHLSQQQGGRIFFSSSGRALTEEDQISILTVGIDVGSSTSHLMFSRIVMERLDSRYVVASRETLFESSILLTPYAIEDTIDAAALGTFIEDQYRQAGVDPEKIDTGALILTGIAAERSNARRVGDLFAREAGKMVAVSAGDGLETVMAAHGSGAVARSLREGIAVMNIDIGGGTCKIAVCSGGKVVERTALDVGSRLVSIDASNRIIRIERAGRLFAAELGMNLEIGKLLEPEQVRSLAACMADRLIQALEGGSPSAGGVPLLRLDPLSAMRIDCVTLSGGVSEYFYGREKSAFGDLGQALAAAVRARIGPWAPRIEPPGQGIRATVIGASQYTTQVSGTTIYVSPQSLLPLRNVPVIAPNLRLDDEIIRRHEVSAAIQDSLARLELEKTDRAIAIFVPWRGSASFSRLDSFCRGVADGLAPLLAQGLPIVLVNDGDVGGLLGIHFHDEMPLHYPVLSIDSLELREFDYIDVGRMLDLSGAVPVVIKSLLFAASGPAPSEALLDRTGRA